MKGLILLDGPDCAGKTTLAKKIKEVAERGGHKAVIHHLGKPVEGECWKEHSEALIKYITEAFVFNTVVIADRHFMSESIYGVIYRAASEYPYSMRFVDMLLERIRAVRVICCPPVEQVVKIHSEMKKVRYEEYDSGMDKIAQAYLNLWSHPVRFDQLPGNNYIDQLTALGGTQDKLGWYHYDYTKIKTEEAAEYYLVELHRESLLMEDDYDDISGYPFLGFANKGNILFVGDRTDPSAENELGIPFFSNSQDAEFFAYTLHQIAVPVDQCVIANINEGHGVRLVKRLMEVCDKVIVLGKDAERTMLYHGLKYDAKVRHPRYARGNDNFDKGYIHELLMALGGPNR